MAATEDVRGMGRKRGDVVRLGETPVLQQADASAGLVGAEVYVDPEVLGHDTVAFAAGSQGRHVPLRHDPTGVSTEPGGNFTLRALTRRAPAPWSG